MQHAEQRWRRRQRRCYAGCPHAALVAVIHRRQQPDLHQQQHASKRQCDSEPACVAPLLQRQMRRLELNVHLWVRGRLQQAAAGLVHVVVRHAWHAGRAVTCSHKRVQGSFVALVCHTLGCRGDEPGTLSCLKLRCVIPLCVLYACFGLSAALRPAYVHSPSRASSPTEGGPRLTQPVRFGGGVKLRCVIPLCVRYACFGLSAALSRRSRVQSARRRTSRALWAVAPHSSWRGPRACRP